MQAILRNYHDINAMVGNGIFVADSKYFYQTSGNGYIIGINSQNGVIIERSKSTVTIATFNKSYKPAEVKYIVDRFVDFLKYNEL